MPKYPTAIFFPCTSKGNGAIYQAFTDYGNREGIDIDLSTDTVFVKKIRASMSSKLPLQNRRVVDYNILEPEFDFAVVNKPQSLNSLMEDDISVDEMLVKKQRAVCNMKRKSEIFHTAPVANHILNLSNDHPEATHGNITEIMKECCAGLHISRRKTMTSLRFESLCRHVDPMLCGGGMTFLSSILCKELRSEMLRRYCDRDYTGGSLVYKRLERSASKKMEFGAIFCSQNQGLELSVQIMGFGLQGDNQRKQEINPKPMLSTEFRLLLNGRALQVDVVPFEQENEFLIATRSDYHVLLSAFFGSHQVWDEHGSSDSHKNNLLSSLCCLKTSGNCKVSCVALSPFILGECVTATEDGVVRLWNADIYNNASGVSTNRLQVLVDQRCEGNDLSGLWRQVNFGAHPRQLYIADESSACIFDIRTGRSSTSMLHMKTSLFTKENEKIYCMQSGRHMGNEFECLIATNYNLFLMDQRHCGSPLMQCGTNMTLPPCYVKPVSITNHENSQDLWRWSNSVSAVLVANQFPQEVYCYQLNKIEKTSLHCPSTTHFPRQCVGPPRILSSFSDVHNYVKLRPGKHQRYLKIRTKKMIVGLDAFSLNNTHQMSDGQKLIVLQMNSVGDIGCQTMRLQNLDAAFEIGDNQTDENFAIYSYSKEKKDHEYFLSEMKRKNFDPWIESVINEDHAGVTVSKMHFAPHVELTITSWCLYESENVEQPTNCKFCSSNQTVSGATFERNSSMKCTKCGLTMQATASIRKLFARSENSSRILLLQTEYASSAGNHGEISDSSFENEDDLDSIFQQLNLLKIKDCENNDCDEVGWFLKDTWSGTNENWEKQRRQRRNQGDAEEQAEDRLALNPGREAPKSNGPNTLRVGSSPEHIVPNIL